MTHNSLGRVGVNSVFSLQLETRKVKQIKGWGRVLVRKDRREKVEDSLKLEFLEVQGCAPYLLVLISYYIWVEGKFPCTHRIGPGFGMF